MMLNNSVSLNCSSVRISLNFGLLSFWLVAMLIPYVNLIAASSFARRYWSEGARAPALLAIAGIVLQTLASLQLLAPVLPALV